jgi:hypothetical protein
MQERADTGLQVIEGGLAAPGETEKSPVGTKQWSAKVRRRAKELLHTLDTGYMELAQILYQVYDTPIDGDRNRAAVFTTWGYSSFKDYAEQELNIEGKRAERLRRMWYVLEIQFKGMEPELKQRIVNLGYSKVRELLRVITMRNASNWVGMAETMSYRQLNAAISDERRKAGIAEALIAADKVDSAKEDGEEVTTAEEEALKQLQEEQEEQTTRETFVLFPAQLANVRLALQKSMETSHSDKKGHNLDLICTDFLATNDFLGDDNEKRLRYIAKIERTLGLKFIVVDPESRDIIYGVDALKLVADG